ncbi:MAG TPA: Holliday junction resolvase RuvX [Candidatus Limnocylindrales bacterium]
MLGIDLGERRIGLAEADPSAGRARPLATLRRARTPAADVRALAAFLAAGDVAELVVGLPLDMTGGEGAQASATRAWAEAVAALTRLPVCLRDERLTSHLAEERLGPMPRGRSGGPPTPHQRETYRARVDREAAAIILQDELDARRDEASPGTAVGASGGDGTDRTVAP